jgi:hypothetical protein
VLVLPSVIAWIVCCGLAGGGGSGIWHCQTAGTGKGRCGWENDDWQVALIHSFYEKMQAGQTIPVHSLVIYRLNKNQKEIII